MGKVSRLVTGDNLVRLHTWACRSAGRSSSRTGDRWLLEAPPPKAAVSGWRRPWPA